MTDDGLLDMLSREYHLRCESYDRTVCTGSLDQHGDIRPANGHELALVNRNARNVIEALMSEFNVPMQTVLEANRQAIRRGR